MFTQFVGEPCGQHGQYTFYKALKFYKHGKYKILNVGGFFFVRISPSDDPCIGELQLLWEDRCNDQRLSSIRLYFLPEQTPDGRHSQHGEHEVIAVSDKVVLRLEDLVHWITDEVEWSNGLPVTCQKDVDIPPRGGVAAGLDAIPGLEGFEPTKAEELSRTFLDQSGLDNADLQEEKVQVDEEDSAQSKEASVVVLSYPRYCRYRAMLQRLSGVENVWLRSAIVVAVGGFAIPKRNTRVLFCRDTFDHEGLLQNDLNCDHLAPNLKSKSKKLPVSGGPIQKQKKVGRSTSPGSESNTSDEIKENIAKVHLEETKNGRKPLCKDEQEFLQQLFKFMQDRSTPIHRVPHLGFKQIDLYFFYNYAQKLGGYEKITCKKLWKHIYDEMGGNPGSTSAATCTRRHYERLLLPFERHTNGEEDKPLPIVPPPRNKIKKSDDSSDVKQEPTDGEDDDFEKQDDDLGTGSETESTSCIKQEPEQATEEVVPIVQVVPSNPSVPTMVEMLKTLKTKNGTDPLQESSLGEKESNWTEKEKRWNEIRRKNALERNWARQMRPAKVTTGVPEKAAVKSELQPPKLYSLAAIQSSLQAKMSNKCNRTQYLSGTKAYKRTAFPVPHDPSRPWSNGIVNGADHGNSSLAQPRPSVIQHTEKMQSASQPLPAHTSGKLTELHRLQLQRQRFGSKLSDYGRKGLVPVPGLAFPKNGTHRLDEQQLPFCRKPRPPPPPPSLPPEGLTKRVSNSYYYSPITQVYPLAEGTVSPKVHFEYPKPSNSPRCGPTVSSLPSALAPSTPSFSKRVCPPSPCEAEVLDLSIKRKATTSAETNGQLVASPQHHGNSEVECLDLSVKKRKAVVIDLSDEARGIENVTPPSPISQEQSDHKSVVLPPLKSPPITSLSLLRSAASDKRPPALVPLSDAKSPFPTGSPYVSDYNPPLPHFVSNMSPHLYPMPPALWSSGQGVMQNNMQHAMVPEGFQASFSAYKEMVERGMFPGQQFPYPFTPQMYPVMYKDGHTFPSYSK